MAEFWAFSRLIREKCDDNTELQKYCQTIAAKYLECEKNELRAQFAHEENIILKIDIGNLNSLYRSVVEKDEAQAELDSLLLEYYEEHLKSTFDVDECEIDKVFKYEELKIELETRDTISVYQHLHWRKMKMAKKMEERNIVKKYRQQEQEYLKTQAERENLQILVDKQKERAEKLKVRQQEQNRLILQLVQGSTDLEAIFAKQCPQISQSQKKIPGSQRLSGIIDPVTNHKGGLSSRLLMNFQQFKVPSTHALPRNRQKIQRNDFSRLLQQAEVIRKSMQSTPITLSNDIPTPKLPSILKTPNDIPKQIEDSSKSVSFEVDFHKAGHCTIDETQEATTKTPSVSSEDDFDSEMAGSFIGMKSKKPKLDIIEDKIIKAADTIHKLAPEVKPTMTNQKRRAGSSRDFSVGSQQKKKCSPPETPYNNGSMTLKDILFDFSKETSLVKSPSFEPLKKTKPEVKKITKTKDKPIEIDDKENSQPKSTFGKRRSNDFEDFFSRFAEDDSNCGEAADGATLDFMGVDKADDSAESESFFAF